MAPITWLIVSFVAVLVLGVLVYLFGQVNDTLSAIPTTNQINISKAAGETIGAVNANIGMYRLIALALIFGFFLSIIISNFLVKSHPAFFILHILITIIAVILAAYVSNAYNDQILPNATIGSTLQGWSGVNFIMTNLPMFVAIVGIIGGIFLYSGIPRDVGLGGGVI